MIKIHRILEKIDIAEIFRCHGEMAYRLFEVVSDGHYPGIKIGDVGFVSTLADLRTINIIEASGKIAQYQWANNAGPHIRVLILPKGTRIEMELE